MSKLAEPWWDLGINPITGFKAGSNDIRGAHKTSDEVKYFNAFPTLEIKNK